MLTAKKLEMSYNILPKASFFAFSKTNSFQSQAFLATFHLKQESRCFPYSCTLPMPKISAKCDFIPEFHDGSSRDHSDVLNTWHFCLDDYKCICWLSGQSIDIHPSPLPKRSLSWPSQPSWNAISLKCKPLILKGSPPLVAFSYIHLFSFCTEYCVIFLFACWLDYRLSIAIE